MGKTVKKKKKKVLYIQVLPVSSSKRCIVYTCIYVLGFLLKNIFLLYVYLQNGENSKEKEEKRKKLHRIVA